MHGLVFVPVVLGSNKMMVSVGTGHTEYYLLYVSASNMHNDMHRAHCNAVSILAFLKMPKTDQQYKDDNDF
ncbi:hypothetical protein ID866_10423 [Astraeus odoratus]|nr:hypothetical protein ID866_10423 [Astraeus odoratus]